MEGQLPRVQAKTLRHRSNYGFCILLLNPLTNRRILRRTIQRLCFTVFTRLVADDWMADVSAMYPQLVGAAGYWLQFQKRG